MKNTSGGKSGKSARAGGRAKTGGGKLTSAAAAAGKAGNNKRNDACNTQKMEIIIRPRAKAGKQAEKRNELSPSTTA